MSVLIKGFEKPDHCLRCPVKGIDDECLLQSEAANADYESWEDQMANCPLVPVPEHGDLIERDAAYDKIAEQEGGNYVDMDVVDMGLNETPTIIPASEEGE